MSTVVRWFAFAAALIVAVPAVAQESRIASDLRREREHIAEDCSGLAATKLISCAKRLATDYPIHVAFGSLPPQNGFALGLAFVERFTPNESWRISWNADAVAAPSGAWRGGAYAKFVHTNVRAPVVTAASAGGSTGGIHEYALFNAYVQGIALDTVLFFGPGGASRLTGKSAFAERQTIIGGSAILPLSGVRHLRPLHASLAGGVNGRFVRIRGTSSDLAPPITQVYDEASAPGLSEQPSFLELQEGIRFKPSTPDGRFRIDYLVELRQFLSREDAHSSFRRWTVDLRHEIPLYNAVSSTGPRDTNGPDECFTSVTGTTCPPITSSRNRSGSIGFRLLASSSTPSSGSRVPFYFQPTLGGSDLNGQRLLASFDDYRFRGPHLLALQESVEHSIWGPFGAVVMAEQGSVAERRADLSHGGLTRSYSAGLTIRAGGLPAINVLFAWGPEGHHVIGTADATLLGGSGRPSLF